ncbi:MAG: hypothetical protein F6K28_29570 [Microcoleus sp. SIO2G3]|nr:hypothetical protein [Microcoleus sp. SIO2G3]
MHEHPQNLRISAARAFMDSLDQLENILAQESQSTELEFQLDDSHSSTSETDLTVWEEAAADIEQFFGETQLPEDEGLEDES